MENTPQYTVNHHQEPLSPDRERVGKFLYKFAWVIEIFAITIGLAIAIMTMVTSFTEIQLYSYTVKMSLVLVTIPMYLLQRFLS